MPFKDVSKFPIGFEKDGGIMPREVVKAKAHMSRV